MRCALPCLFALFALACSGNSKLDPAAGGGGGGHGGNGGNGAGSAASNGGAGEAAGGTGGGGSGGNGTGGNGASSGGIPLPAAPTADELLASSCRRDVEMGQLLPANILFVLDRSRSMVCNPPPTTDSATCEREGKRAASDVPSKWEITRSAIVESLNILPEEAWVGLSYFSNNDSCGVQASPSVPMRKNSAPQKDLINTSLERSQPSGATPLVGATILAYRHLHELAREGSIRGNTFVVLLTDGKQSEDCGDPARCTTAEECTNLLIEEEVPKAAGEGVWIRTFVIGVPGSELDSRTLSLIADAGGTARVGCTPERDCHFDVSRGGDFSPALRQALQNIIGQTRTCDLPAPRPESGDQERVNVVYTSPSGARELVLRDNRTCDGVANGWQYAENRTRIRLCGKVCSDLQANPDSQLQVVIGCPIQGPE